MLLTGVETSPSNWTNAYHTPNQYAMLRVSYPHSGGVKPTWRREKAGTSAVSFFHGYNSTFLIAGIVNNGYEYLVTPDNTVSGRDMPVSIDDAFPGDVAVVKVPNVGNFNGLLINNLTNQVNSLSAFRSSSSSCYYIDGTGMIWIKFIVPVRSQSIRIRWS